MANTVLLKGVFGKKQSFNVTSTTAATAWYAGYLFRLDRLGSAGPWTSYTDPYVEPQLIAGAPIMGVVMENYTDFTSPVYGMSQPSSSKVTLLHGHSMFEIQNASATKCYETAVESAAVMDLLFCSVNAKWTTASGSTSSHPIGFLTKVPCAANSYTLGVVLYG